MKLLQLILLSLLTTLLFVAVSQAAIVPLNVQGTITGTCNAAVNVSVIGYCAGQLGNASCIVDQTSVIANGAGVYGTSLTYDNAVHVTGLDVLITATNTSCASTAFGNVSAFNQVGGGPPVTINGNISNPFTLGLPSNGSLVSNQTINFTWTNNIVNPSSTIEIDNDPAFGSVDATLAGVPDENLTFATALVDGLYYWRILTFIGATLIQQSGVYNFTLANSAPVISNISPDNSTWFSSTTTTLSFNTDITATCAYATASSVAFASKTTFTTTGGTTHSATVPLGSNGINTFYLQCNSTGGVLMPTDTTTNILRDTTNPDASGATVQINGGATTATSSTINISWSGFTDSTSNITGYYVNTTNNQGTTTGLFTNTTSAQLTGIADGSVTAYVWAVDEAGNIGSAASDSITVDTAGPTFSLWSSNPVNLNIFSTSSVTIFVTVSDGSSLAGLPQLRYRIGSDAYSTPADMTLVGGSVYSFVVPNQAAPNDWANRGGENLTVLVNATDASNFQGNDTYSIYINNMFTAPVFSPVSSTTILQGVNTSILLGSFDADGDTLTYSSNVSGISFIALNTTHSYAYWLPQNSDVGSNIVIFNVTDGFFNVSQAVIINVTDTNDAPEFATIPALSAYEYEQFNYTVNATDVDGDTLTFSINSTLFAISSLGEILFTPTATFRGLTNLLFTVSDGNGGVDTQNVSFTVLYCGDNICSSSFESSETCSLDCEDDETSQGFLVGSKTCLGETMTIRAVELVPRTTCGTIGTIINGWESCDNLSSTTIRVEQDIQNTYVGVATLVTNDDGLVSYTPNETGDYRLRYDSTDYDENIVYFGIRECTVDEEATQPTDSTNQAQEQQEVNLPFFEEPLTEEQIVQLSATTRILYFILLPFLFVLILGAGVTTYYRYDKKKGKGSFSHSVDEQFAKVQQSMQKVQAKYQEEKWYKQLVATMATLRQSVIGVKKTAVKSIEPYINKKQLSVPFYGQQLGQLSETQLLLQSIFNHYFKSKKSANFANALQREPLFQDKNLRIFALNANKLGIPLHYEFSTTKDKGELLLLHEHVPVQKSYPTLTDMKSELIKNNVVVIPLHMKTLNQAAPDQTFMAILTGFTKDGFVMLDYSFSRKEKTLVPPGLLQQAWSRTGYLECIIIKK